MKRSVNHHVRRPPISRAEGAEEAHQAQQAQELQHYPHYQADPPFQAVHLTDEDWHSHLVGNAGHWGVLLASILQKQEEEILEPVHLLPSQVAMLPHQQEEQRQGRGWGSSFGGGEPQNERHLGFPVPSRTYSSSPTTASMALHHDQYRYPPLREDPMMSTAGQQYDRHHQPSSGYQQPPFSPARSSPSLSAPNEGRFRKSKRSHRRRKTRSHRRRSSRSSSPRYARYKESLPPSATPPPPPAASAAHGYRWSTAPPSYDVHCSNHQHYPSGDPHYAANPFAFHQNRSLEMIPYKPHSNDDHASSTSMALHSSLAPSLSSHHFSSYTGEPHHTTHRHRDGRIFTHGQPSFSGRENQPHSHLHQDVNFYDGSRSHRRTDHHFERNDKYLPPLPPPPHSNYFDKDDAGRNRMRYRHDRSHRHHHGHNEDDNDSRYYSDDSHRRHHRHQSHRGENYRQSKKRRRRRRSRSHHSHSSESFGSRRRHQRRRSLPLDASGEASASNIPPHADAHGVPAGVVSDDDDNNNDHELYHAHSIWVSNHSSTKSSRAEKKPSRAEKQDHDAASFGDSHKRRRHDGDNHSSHHHRTRRHHSYHHDNHHDIDEKDHNGKGDERDSGSRGAKARSASSARDDTIGHFEGGPGTIIADQYKVLRDVGMGTFGRVVECLDLRSVGRSASSTTADHRSAMSSSSSVKHPEEPQHHSRVAIKIVRKIRRYHESALIEADIVQDVNRKGGRGRSLCALLLDRFEFSGHYCLAFECLGMSLYDFLRSHDYRPFPLYCVQRFAIQLLDAVDFLHSFGLIHTDLKPENILLVSNDEMTHRRHDGTTQIVPADTRIKVIDFGGATYDHEKKSSVVNTRQYRAPEVILGWGWSTPSDLWSAGCIIAELYMGELLFATHDNAEHLALIEQAIGRFPRRLLKSSPTKKKKKNSRKRKPSATAPSSSRSKSFSHSPLVFSSWSSSPSSSVSSDNPAGLSARVFDSRGYHRMNAVLSHSSMTQVRRMRRLEEIISHRDTPSGLITLLSSLLTIDPRRRATAGEALGLEFCTRKL